jgi:DHA1 family bicyclomycin/chloramphenicol resistance-like MFS transporter
MIGRLPPLAFTAFLAYCSAISALAVDMSLPAFDPIRVAFATTTANAVSTLTLFMTAFALTQPLFGAASQRFGRRPVLLFGCALFGACGFGCATAGSIGELLAWRAMQGVGASACAVLVFAIVRDRLSGEPARRLIANVSATMMIAPMIAPSLGAAILSVTSWRGIFIVLGVAGALLLLVTMLFFSETLGERDPQALVPSHVLGSYARLARNRTASGYALIAALSFGGMFAYIAGSSTLFIDELGTSPRTYGLLFALTSLAIVGGNLASNGFARIGISFRIALATGLVVAIVSACGLLVLAFAKALMLADAVPMLAINTFALGLIAPNAAHGVLEEVPEMAGAGSAALGSGRVLCGALASATVAALAHLGPLGMALTMTAFAMVSLAIYLAVVRPDDRDVRARARA